MKRMKRTANFGRSADFLRIASLGLLLLLSALFGPAGCSSSASMRYRAQHQNNGRLLHDNTVEQLQACVEEFGDQAGANSLPVSATVQVDREGRVHGVSVTGIPESAPDLAVCTRIALRNMIVPDLPLRSDTTGATANESTKATGNELANPIILVEIAVALSEFAAEHAGRVVLYTVTIEVLTAAAIAGATVYLKKKKRKTCTQHLSDCLMTPFNDERGNNWNTRRCKTCFDLCRDGNWPAFVPFIPEPESCSYPGM